MASEIRETIVIARRRMARVRPVRSALGHVEVPGDFAAELDAHTGDGRIRMQDVTLSNVTGNIGRNTVRGRLGAGGGVRVRTGDGSITLRRS